MRAEIFNIHGKLFSDAQYTTSTEANRITGLRAINTTAIKDDVYFVRLKLTDKNQELIDENFYWLSQQGKSYEKLNELKEVQLKIELTESSAKLKTVKISNSGNETAFFARLKITNETSKDLVLPVFFSENYFTLLPGESRVITIDLSLLQEKVRSGILLLETEGWNIKKRSVQMTL